MQKYSSSIVVTADAALQALAAAVDKAKAINVPQCIFVVDPSGETIARLRQGQSRAPTATAVRQWPVLCRLRSRRMAGDIQDRPGSRRSGASADARQDRTLASDIEEPYPAGKLLLQGRPRSPDRSLHRALQPSPIPREPRQSHARRRLLRARPDHPHRTRKDQTRVSATNTPPFLL